MEKKTQTDKVATTPILTEWDRRFMAFHEAGHAVCGAFLTQIGKVQSVTIDPSNKAFGMVGFSPRFDHNETETSFLSRVATFLAGRISEEMFLKETTTSAIYDLANARNIAMDMVMKFGMGKRTRYLASGDWNSDKVFVQSEAYKKMVDSDIYDILRRAQKLAEKVLREKSELVNEVAEKLLTKGTLSKIEIKKYFYKDAK